MKLLKCSTLTVCLALIACGSQIDERQTDVIQGLVYKHGDTDPYTGTVIHSKVTRFQSLVVGDCTLHYTKGVIDGKIECSANNGTKIFETNIADEKRSGTEKHWSPETGGLTYQVSWDADIKDGVEKVYDTSGKTLLHQVTWAKGVQAGSEKEWDANGKLLTDLDWKDGKKSGTQTTVNSDQVTEATFKDGVFNGMKKVSDATGVIEETPFDQGVITGTQTFYRFGVPEVVRQWSDGKVVSESVKRHVDKATVYETDAIQCTPMCRAYIYVNGKVAKIDLSGATNSQVQFPKLVPQNGVNVDEADQLKDGFGTFTGSAQSIGSGPIADTIEQYSSKIAKLETIFKNDNVDGVQRAYDANGALILQVQWNNGQWVSATGSPAANAPPTVTVVASTAGKLYPNGMAQSFAQCSMPGFETDSALCHPVGVPVPMPTTPAAPKTASAASLDSINDQLSTLGMLDAQSLNPQGYPVMSVECNDQTKQCVNAGGTAIGDENDVAAQMLPVRQEDIISQNYKCDVICRDEQGDIIGRVPDFKSSK